MQRVKTATAIAERPAYSAGGTPGFFRSGDAVAAIPPTVPGQDWFNMMQEEVANVILAAGLTLDAEVDTQLRDSIMALIASALATSWPGVATAGADGTVDAITAAFSPVITLADRKLVTVVAAGANTSTAPTFAPNGLAAHPITKAGGQALAAGNIPRAGFVAVLQYNLANTRWELLNPVEAAATTTLEQFLMYS